MPSSVRIFKWVIEPERRQLLQVPIGTKFLSVARQNELLVLWGEVPSVGESVDSDGYGKVSGIRVTSHESRVLVVVTTGDEFETEGKEYIGSAELGKAEEGQWYVAHVYAQQEGHKDPIDHRNHEDRSQILSHWL